MSNNREYYGGSCGNGCSYASLGAYYGSEANYQQRLPYQIVPTHKSMTPGWGGVSYYDVLTHGGKSCNGHANITNAYGPNADNCPVSYQKRSCGS
jgi:hypothetical protein